MSKIILLSIIIAMIAIPARLARVKDAKAGLKRVIVQMLVFDVFYILALKFLYGRWD